MSAISLSGSKLSFDTTRASRTPSGKTLPVSTLPDRSTRSGTFLKKSFLSICSPSADVHTKAQEMSEMCDKSSEISEMRLSVNLSASEEMREHIVTLMRRSLAEYKEGKLRDVARWTGFGYSRTRSLFHREARVIKSEEMDAVRAAVAQKEENSERKTLHDKLERIENLLESLVSRDAEFYSPEIDAYRGILSMARNELIKNDGAQS